MANEKGFPKTKRRTVTTVVCGEYSCIWNDLYYKRRYDNGCTKYADISACREACTVDEAETRGLVDAQAAMAVRMLQESGLIYNG